MGTLETINHDGSTIAIIMRKDFQTPGISFVTPEDYPLQLGHMSRPAGYEILPHVHNPITRTVVGTQEVLFIKSGKIEMDFYSFDQEYLESRRLEGGDIVWLIGAGHGITVLEPTVMVEVKNGPYHPDQDKGRFPRKKAASV